MATPSPQPRVGGQSKHTWKGFYDSTLGSYQSKNEITSQNVVFSPKKGTAKTAENWQLGARTAGLEPATCKLKVWG